MPELVNSSFAWGLVAGLVLAGVPLVLAKHLCPHYFTCKNNNDNKCHRKHRHRHDGEESPVRSHLIMEKSSQLDQLEQQFRVPISKLHDIVKHFMAELQKGLKTPGQTIKALPSYVTRLPTGQETGTFLALDLGGTNLRVCEVVLEGHGKFRMRQKKYKISDDMKVCSAEVFFDYIATAVSEFIRENAIEHGFDKPALKLGFTFSFPVDQTAIDCGLLMQWNKGFEVSGTLNQNVVQLMKDAFERKQVNVHVVAVINDTVGTLVTHRYVDAEAYIGVIIGTGTNAAYVEKVSKIPKWQSHYGNVPVETDEMIINIEWGAFDNEKVVLPVTKYDTRLDRHTENPGKQVFEKMISGMYLGEIARLVLVDLIHAGELFHGDLPSKLDRMFSFETQYMSRIERDHSQDLTDIKALLEDMFDYYSSTIQDRLLVKRVCELVGIRSARLAAAAVAAVISKMNRLNGCTVAIDGSVFEHYPHYRNRMSDALREVFGVSSDNIVLELARDGSGAGAALVAAVMG